MRVIISGSSGFIGSAAVDAFRRSGAEVVPLVRSGTNGIVWDPDSGKLDPKPFEGCDAVIHLGGENIFAHRWNERRKAGLVRSRVASTSLLARTLAGLAARPKVLIVASGVGIYGDRGDELLDERSAPGSDFLAELCKAWEGAAQPAQAGGVRTVFARFGGVLHRSGGALKTMLLPFSLGIGGRLGSGRQWLSWISRTDAVRALELLVHGTASGPVNVVSPEPVTNRELTKLLGRALHRPTIFPVPAPLLRLLFGQIADDTFLASQRAVPARLMELGFQFRDRTLAEALPRLVHEPD